MDAGFNYKKIGLSALYFRIIFHTLAALNLLLAGASLAPAQYVYTTPEKLDDGLETASLRDVSIDPEKIDKLIQDIHSINANDDGEIKTKIDGILLIKDGQLVLEEYFNNQDRNKLHGIKSVTKSIGSVLTGIAIDKGFIEKVDEKIFPFLKTIRPEALWDEKGKRITLKHLLTMTSGYECDDQLTNFRCQYQMSRSEDWVKFALDLPVTHEPGEHWAYNSSTPMLIAAVIKGKSGLSIREFAKSYLFQQLGIQDGLDFRWQELDTPNGVDPAVSVFFAGGAFMKPRAMAKFGYMVLNGGRWNNHQIVSQSWIKESTGAHATTNRNFKYGYLWWGGETVVNNQKLNVIWASGHGGQRIFIVPELKSVIVFISELQHPTGILTHGLITTHIIPAILPPASPRSPHPSDSGIVQKYPGQYVFKQNTNFEQKLKIELRGDRLWLKPSGWSELEIFPESEHQFFGVSRQLGDILIQFSFDEYGNVSHMTLDFALTSWECKKM